MATYKLLSGVRSLRHYLSHRTIRLPVETVDNGSDSIEDKADHVLFIDPIVAASPISKDLGEWMIDDDAATTETMLNRGCDCYKDEQKDISIFCSRLRQSQILAFLVDSNQRCLRSFMVDPHSVGYYQQHGDRYHLPLVFALLFEKLWPERNAISL